MVQHLFIYSSSNCWLVCVTDHQITKMTRVYLKQLEKPALISGDFEYHIEWNSLTGKRSDDTNFLNHLNDAFLFQLVQNPTRGSNILDLVMTTEENMVEDVTVGEHFGTIDHQIVRWNLPIGKERADNGSNKLYSFFKADNDVITNTLTKVDLTWKTIDINVKESWEIIKGELNNEAKIPQ